MPLPASRVQEINGCRFEWKVILSEDQEGSEKIVCSGEYESEPGGESRPCVFCFAKESHNGTLLHEERVLRHLGAHEREHHPMVIGLLGTVDHWGAADGPRCLVLELVEPLGYDLAQVGFQQRWNCPEAMPLEQLRYYVHQLVRALMFLRDRGTVHRDLKPENVLIDSDQCVKLIDFGLATAPGIVHEDRRISDCLMGYIAPELEAEGNQGSFSTDVWGLGLIIYHLCTGESQLRTHELLLEGLRERMQRLHVHADAIDIVERSLCQDPEQRWTLEQVLNWAGETSLPRSMLPGSPLTGVLQPWRDFEHGRPTALGAQLPEHWQHDGKTIGELNLFSVADVLVLLVVRNAAWKKLWDKDDETWFYVNILSSDERDEPPECGPMEVVSVPSASTVLRSTDWIYFAARDRVDAAHCHDVSHQVAVALAIEATVDLAAARSKNVTNISPFLPEFDHFPFPEHCAGRVLGQPRHAGGGLYLDLRARFHVNLAGILHPNGKVLWWPGPDTIVGLGDRGLVMRIPLPSQGGRQEPLSTVSREALVALLDHEQFRERMSEYEQPPQ